VLGRYPEQVIWNDSDQTVSIFTQAETVDGHPFVSGAIRTKDKYTITKDSSNQPILRGGVEVTAKSIDDAWHKYGFEWNVNSSRVALTWYFDGKPYYQIEMNKNNDKYTALTRNTQNGKTNNFFCQTAKCPTIYGVSLEKAAYQSFQNGFFGDQGDSEGYYLILNMAVGGPVNPEPDPSTFPVTEMKISDVHRYIINGS
jgi:beta-glucanase (GH16 family)